MFVLPLGTESEDLGEDAGKPAVATWGLVAACVLVHALLWWWAPFGSPDPATLREWYYRPERPLGLGLLTHQFLHSGFVHLAGNCLFLAAFGVVVERRLGPRAVVVTFLVGGATGAWLYGLFADKAHVVTATGATSFSKPLLGASGALMGLVGCLLPVMPTARLRVLVWAGIYARVFAVPAWVVAGGFLAKELFLAVTQPGAAVAYTAHVGGLLGGAVAAALLPEVRGAREGAPPGAASPDVAPTPPPVEEAPVVEDPAAMEAATDLGTVGRDSVELSGIWGRGARDADLRQRMTRARELEKDPPRARIAFAFYRRVLQDRDLDPGYRAFAGARMARMLLRARRLEEAEDLARKLLRNPLPPSLLAHLKATSRAAYEARTTRGARPEDPFAGLDP